jgi:hypothetical protein
MTLVVETAIHEYRAVDLLHEIYHKDFYSTFLRARIVWARLETPQNCVGNTIRSDIWLLTL